MTALVLIGLIVVCAKLWSDVRALKLRVAALGSGEAPAAALAPRVREPAAPRADASVRYRTTPAAPEPKPEPTPEPRVVPPLAAPPSAALHVERPAPPQRPAPPPRPAIGFEELFGRKLPIWAGGVTLAVAGFLIVKYSIDAGLLSPAVRVVCGLLFGAGLIAGAETALSAEARVRDPRVRQALAGAGVATLYACVLVAANVYHLIGPVTAFVGLALITALAGGLSLRFGAPSALLGLVGGLAAPALVGSGSPDVPLLSAYLALAVGGLCTLSRNQRWMWLGVSALIGGFGWGLLLILGGTLDAAASLSVGVYMLLLGVALPLFAFPGASGVPVRTLASIAACGQLAALVATGGFGELQWGLFALISIATVWLSRREAALADLPIPALTIALLLVAVWPHPSPAMLTLVLGGIAAIYGGPAAWRVWRSDMRLSDAGAVAAIAIGIAVLPLLHLTLGERDTALLALLGAGVAGAVAALGWSCATRREDARFAMLAITAAVLLAAALVVVALAWLVAPAIAVVAVATLLLAGLANDPRVERGAVALGLGALAALSLAPPSDLLRGLGVEHAAGTVQEALRWLVPALAAMAFAWRARSVQVALVAQPFAVVLAYGAAAQLVPAPFLPLVPAAFCVALAMMRGTLPALLAAAAILGGWVVLPLFTWAAAAGGAVFGLPVFVTALPPLADVALRLLVPALVIGFLALRQHDPLLRRSAAIGGAVLAFVSLHVAFKQVFAIDGHARFVALGMAERTAWELLLAAGALALWRRAPRIAQGLAAASLAHFVAFTALLHDPLWTRQAVGEWPLLNWLLPAYALAFALLRQAGRIGLPAWAERSRGWVQMALVTLFAAAQLRQLAHGSLLVAGRVSEGEDIARSVLLIALAGGFLRHGIVHAARDWRIASLVLLLAAVAKVFLLDAAGLDGLARIASFAALGFSLIGIGWLYARYLPEPVGLTPDSPFAATTERGE